MKHSMRRLTAFALSSAAMTGSANPGGIPIWSGSTTPSNTLGNSTIFETQGMVGIDTTSPAAILHVVDGGGFQVRMPR